MFKLLKGQVKSLEIPRPRAGQDVTGVGKIFVEFTNTEGSNKGTDIYRVFIKLLKWGASFQRSSSLNCPMRNSDEMTIGKTHSTLVVVCKTSEKSEKGIARKTPEMRMTPLNKNSKIFPHFWIFFFIQVLWTTFLRFYILLLFI